MSIKKEQILYLNGLLEFMKNKIDNMEKEVY